MPRMPIFRDSHRQRPHRTGRHRVLGGGTALALLAAVSVALPFSVAPHPAQAARLSVALEGAELDSIDLYSRSAALVIVNDRYQNETWAGRPEGRERARQAVEDLRAAGFDTEILENADATTLRNHLSAFLTGAGAHPEARLLIWFSGQTVELDGRTLLLSADAPAQDAADFVAKALDLDELMGLPRMPVAARHVLALVEGCGNPDSLTWQKAARPSSRYGWEDTLPTRQAILTCGAKEMDTALGTAMTKVLTEPESVDTNEDALVTPEEFLDYLHSHGLAQARLGTSKVAGFGAGRFVLQTRNGAEINTKEMENISTAAGHHMRKEMERVSGMSAPQPSPSAPPVPMAADSVSPLMRTAPPPMPSPLPPQPMPAPESRDRYKDIDTNPVHAVSEQPVSTFSIDVDTAAYANVRRFLQEGNLPPKDAIRVEEMVNYFDYAYPAPTNKARPFKATASLMPTPWNTGTQLLHIGIKGWEMSQTKRPPLNLVFLLDVSGSMNSSDKLPLLKAGMRLLVQQLDQDDRVSIVTYAGRDSVALEPTSGADKGKILAAIETLGAGGSTAGAAGITRAYQLARANFDAKAVNRVILGTDGDFNVGLSRDRSLEELIERERESGVYLSVLGFGRGNYNDQMMQILAQKGNGNAYYIDNLLEARKVLVEELARTLIPIANDVKIQVEFNPDRITEYRLIGFETRKLRREDFSNDKVDAGEIGAGHSVTALYEVTPVGSQATLLEPLRYGDKDKPKSAATPAPDKSSEFAFLRMRYKQPGEKTSQLIETPITEADVKASLDAAGTEARFAAAVAGFAQLLKDDTYLKDFSYAKALDLARGARGDDPNGLRSELVRLIQLAQTLAGKE